MKFTNLISLVLIFCFAACESDEMPMPMPMTCSLDIDLGEVRLLDSTKDLSPYKEVDKLAIFKDSNGSEIEYQLKPIVRIYESNAFNAPCKSNQEIFPIYRIKNELHRMELFNDSETLGFRTEIYTEFNTTCPEEKQVADLIKFSSFNILVQFNNGSDTWFDELTLTINKRGYVEYEPLGNDYIEITFYDEIELNGLVYNNVYLAENDYSQINDFRKFYFSLEFGVLAFTNFDGEDLVVLDRIE